MADFADIGSDYTERWLEGAIEERRHQASIAQQFEIGRCRNCDDKLDDGRSYCNNECRDDHSARMQAEKRMGKRWSD